MSDHKKRKVVLMMGGKKKQQEARECIAWGLFATLDSSHSMPTAMMPLEPPSAAVGAASPAPAPRSHFDIIVIRWGVVGVVNACRCASYLQERSWDGGSKGGLGDGGVLLLEQ